LLEYGVFYTSLLQRLLALPFGKGGVGTKDYLLTQLLLPFDFRQQQFFPVLGAVDVAGRQPGS
jgi:hypothetical protein